MKTRSRAFVDGIIFVMIMVVFCNMFLVSAKMLITKSDVVETKSYLESYHGDVNNIGYESARLTYEECDKAYGELIDGLRNSLNPINRVLGGTSNIIRIPFALIILLIGSIYFIRCYNLYLRRR